MDACRGGVRDFEPIGLYPHNNEEGEASDRSRPYPSVPDGNPMLTRKDSQSDGAATLPVIAALSAKRGRRRPCHMFTFAKCRDMRYNVERLHVLFGCSSFITKKSVPVIAGR